MPDHHISIAFPYHDPELRMHPHLKAILPDLKSLFDRAFISPPPDTSRHSGLMEWLALDNFFTIFPLDQDLPIGATFAFLYSRAARAADPGTILHLAYLDRLSFALQGTYRERFMADVRSIQPNDLPLIFQRSKVAWESHPENYREIEGFVTTVGKWLFGRTLDYAWCHLVLLAGQLSKIMPHISSRDLSMVAEIILELQPGIDTKAVDWLAWEDPFLLGRNLQELKVERENDPMETQKRLSYALPMIKTMLRYASEQTRNSVVQP
jgi:hypothetical protein